MAIDDRTAARLRAVAAHHPVAGTRQTPALTHDDLLEFQSLLATDRWMDGLLDLVGH
jgi:hypothetical protein